MEATMDLNLVSTFVRVGELGSFTAAARALGLPTSSVSRKVSALEGALDVRLIQRSTRKLILTEAGRAYFERARASLAGLADATASVADMSHEVAGVIRFTAPPDNAGLLAGFLAEFLARYPKVRLDVVLTARRVDLVAEGIDLALRGGRLGDSSLIVRRIGSGDLALYGAASYFKRAGTPRTLAELARHRFVLYGGPEVRRTLALTGPDGEETVAIDGPLVVDDMIFAGDAVAAGIGIGVLPRVLAERRSPRSRAVMGPPLVRVLPDYRMSGADLSIVSPPKAYEPTRVSLFRDFLAARYTDLLKGCDADVAEDGTAVRRGHRTLPTSDIKTRVRVTPQ
jgi:DNA-binding transcriptional LysR family regulator